MLRAIQELSDQSIQQVVWWQEIAQHLRQQTSVDTRLLGRRTGLHSIQEVSSYFEHLEKVGLQVWVAGQFKDLRVTEDMRVSGGGGGLGLKVIAV